VGAQAADLLGLHGKPGGIGLSIAGPTEAGRQAVGGRISAAGIPGWRQGLFAEDCQGEALQVQVRNLPIVIRIGPIRAGRGAAGGIGQAIRQELDILRPQQAVAVQVSPPEKQRGRGILGAAVEDLRGDPKAAVGTGRSQEIGCGQGWLGWPFQGWGEELLQE
jgi:hypothetical protein